MLDLAPAPAGSVSASPPRPPRHRGPAIVLAFAAAVTAAWVTVAVRAAGHGLDLTDEGFYLLSYRWWNADRYSFTGAQYLYGPVFALLGHDIAALRLFRLGTVLLAHLGFGLAFLRWLRLRRPDAPPTRLWEAAGAAVVTAAGGAVYSWLPQTPGYNDVVLLGTLTGLAIVFAMARRAELAAPAAPASAAAPAGPIPGWLPFLLGVTVALVLLAKWAAALLLGLVAVAAVVALAPAGWRAVLRAAAWATCGLGAAALGVHLLVVPLTSAIPPILAVNRTLAESSFSIPVLLARYYKYTLPTVETVLREYGLLLFAALIVAVARHRLSQIAGGLLGAAGLVLAVRHTLTDGGLGGGAVNVLKFAVPLLAAGLVALVMAVAGRIAGKTRGGSAGAGGPASAGGGERADRRAAVLLGVLLILPLGFAFGTSNIPLKVSVMAFAAWIAVLVAVVTGMDRRSWAARGIAASVTAGALLVVACVATGGTWRNPYRGVPNVLATETVPGVPALDGLRLAPEEAARYAALRARLAPHLEPPGRKVLGLDKMAGVVLLLDGRTVGEGWYAPENPARTRTGIAAECVDGPPWPAGRAPILVLNRPPRPGDNLLLLACGLDVTTDYRQLAPATETGGLTVLVPR